MKWNLFEEGLDYHTKKAILDYWNLKIFAVFHNLYLIKINSKIQEDNHQQYFIFGIKFNDIYIYIPLIYEEIINKIIFNI